MPGHCPYIARTLPVHCPYIARWVFSTKTRFRALKKGNLFFSFFIYAQVRFYRKNPSGNVRAMYGQCTGNVRALYGHRAGTKTHFEGLDKRLEKSSPALVILPRFELAANTLTCLFVTESVSRLKRARPEPTCT